MAQGIHLTARKTLVLLVALIVLSVLAGMLFEAQIAALSERLVQRLGRPGLGLAIALNDLVISPVPPDLLLLVLSKSPGAHDLFGFVAVLGLCSAIGGTTAWLIASRWGRPDWFGRRFEATVQEHHDLVSRYGVWAVGLAAVTPLPFSLVCWLAGFVKLESRHFLPMTLLRVPRFLAYYALLLYSARVSGWFGF